MASTDYSLSPNPRQHSSGYQELILDEDVMVEMGGGRLGARLSGGGVRLVGRLSKKGSSAAASLVPGSTSGIIGKKGNKDKDTDDTSEDGAAVTVTNNNNNNNSNGVSASPSPKDDNKAADVKVKFESASSWLSLRRRGNKDKGSKAAKVTKVKDDAAGASGSPAVGRDSEIEGRDNSDDDNDDEEGSRSSGSGDGRMSASSSGGAAAAAAAATAPNGATGFEMTTMTYVTDAGKRATFHSGMPTAGAVAAAAAYCEHINNDIIVISNSNSSSLLAMCNLTPIEGREWIHPPESLTKSCVSYNAKFLGVAEVDQPTGIDVVKEAVVKAKFNNQLKLSEGQRPAKVAISISLNGISIIEPKTKEVLHSRPLNTISYCADDKTDKGIFTFIAKQPDTNKHSCFVFESEKSAEEITLTIGQSFDLAYQKFVEASSKDLNLKKQFLSLQKRVQDLMQENSKLKERISELEARGDVVKVSPSLTETNGFSTNHAPHRQHSTPAKDTARASTGSLVSPPLLAPPPATSRSHHAMPGTTANAAPSGADMFGSTPFVPSTPSNTAWASGNTGADDPFGMGTFTPSTGATVNTKTAAAGANWTSRDLQNPLLRPTVDFSLTELDPLRCK